MWILEKKGSSSKPMAIEKNNIDGCYKCEKKDHYINIAYYGKLGGRETILRRQNSIKETGFLDQKGQIRLWTRL